ncbi:unnamed protein product, partial [Sphacelaria rigidula]
CHYTFVAVATSGRWIDDNDSGWADPGELVSYLITVINRGTVTLGALTVESFSGDTNCTGLDLGFLGQDSSID